MDVTKEFSKIFKGLIIEFEKFEAYLKYFNAEKMVTNFMNSAFFNSKSTYKEIKSACRAFMIDECGTL